MIKEERMKTSEQSLSTCDGYGQWLQSCDLMWCNLLMLLSQQIELATSAYQEVVPSTCSRWGTAKGTK